MDLIGFDPPGNDNFPALCVLSILECGDGFGRGHPLMSLIVMPHPDPLLIRDSEINTRDGTLILSF